MSWYQMLSTLRANREEQAQQQRQATPPTICPIDGAILTIGRDGTRNCPMGNYSYPARTTPTTMTEA